MLRTYLLLDCFADALHEPPASNKALVFPINRILPSSFKYRIDKCLASARERESASRWKIGWLSFDSLGALVTPGRRHVCQAVRDKSSTILSIKRRNSTRSDSSLFVFVIRKTLNQRSLLFRAPTRNRLETALHGSGGQAILVFTCDCCHQPLVHLKFLVGMLDEDRRDNAKGGLASDHQPSCGCCGSPRGRASRRRVVRCNSARQLRSQYFRFALHASGFDPSSLSLRPRRHRTDFSCGFQFTELRGREIPQPSSGPRARACASVWKHTD